MIKIKWDKFVIRNSKQVRFNLSKEELKNLISFSSEKIFKTKGDLNITD